MTEVLKLNATQVNELPYPITPLTAGKMKKTDFLSSIAETLVHEEDLYGFRLSWSCKRLKPKASQ